MLGATLGLTRVPIETETFMTLGRKRSWILAAVWIFLTICLASAAIVEQGEGPEDTFLKSVWQARDSVGVDVVLGKASALEAPISPRLAALKGYAPKQRDWG